MLRTASCENQSQCVQEQSLDSGVIGESVANVCGDTNCIAPDHELGRISPVVESPVLLPDIPVSPVRVVDEFGLPDHAGKISDVSSKDGGSVFASPDDPEVQGDSLCTGSFGVVGDDVLLRTSKPLNVENAVETGVSDTGDDVAPNKSGGEPFDGKEEAVQGCNVKQPQAASVSMEVSDVVFLMNRIADLEEAHRRLAFTVSELKTSSDMMHVAVDHEFGALRADVHKWNVFRKSVVDEMAIGRTFREAVAPSVGMEPHPKPEMLPSSMSMGRWGNGGGRGRRQWNRKPPV